MIPQVAYFYWTGGPLPWLRAQSMATFQRHHPGWRVVLGSPEWERDAPPGVVLERDDVTRADLPPAARADWWRWHVLGTRGGLYADTDVLFVRNVEPLLVGAHDAWITTDGGTPCVGSLTKWTWTYDANGKRVSKRPGGGSMLSIGVLAAPHGGSKAFNGARALASHTQPGDYQSHGTHLLAANWAALTRNVSLGAIPFRAFYRGWSDEDVRALWQPGTVRPHEYGVHWYGGSVESRPFEGALSVGDLPDSVVRATLLS